MATPKLTNAIPSLVGAYSGGDSSFKYKPASTTDNYPQQDYLSKGLIPSSSVAMQAGPLKPASNAAQKGQSGSKSQQGAYEAVQDLKAGAQPSWMGKKQEEMGEEERGLIFDYDIYGKAYAARPVLPPAEPQKEGGSSSGINPAGVAKASTMPMDLLKEGARLVSGVGSTMSDPWKDYLNLGKKASDKILMDIFNKNLAQTQAAASGRPFHLDIEGKPVYDDKGVRSWMPL